MKFKFPIALSNIKITVEAGPCYGPCPIYTLSILGTGEVTFEGKGFVVAEGSYSKMISPEKVKDLIAGAFEIGFFEMKNHYSNEQIFKILPDGTLDKSEMSVSDHPLKIYQIRIGDKEKKIRAYWGDPKRLGWFHDLILDLTDAHEWIGDRNSWV